MTILAIFIIIGTIWTVDSWASKGGRLETIKDWIIFVGISCLVVVGMAAVGHIIYTLNELI